MKKNGFTLLELMIVVTIISIIGSFALPRYLHAVERVRWAEAKTILPVFRGAQLRYKAQWGMYTDNTDSLDADVTPGKYFAFYPANNSGTWVAFAYRNAFQDSLQLNGQYLWINENGDYWYSDSVPVWLR